MAEVDFEIEEPMSEVEESDNESVVGQKKITGGDELDDSDFENMSETDSEFAGGEGSGSEIEEAEEEEGEIDITLDRKRKSASIEEVAEYSSDEDDEEEEEEDENYLQKLDEHYHKKVIENFHPELKTINYEEVEMLATVVRDKDNNIIDPLHKTIPILSRYERARILGERAKQINSGAKPFIDVEPSMMDGYLIALKELEQKRIPFIIQRPLPNGASEYWRVTDLEVL